MKKYDELITDLKKTEKYGFVQIHSSGNPGIDKTLEDPRNIEENNTAGSNGHQTELKSARKESPSTLTPFTEPPVPARINAKLLQKFGRLVSNGRKKLHTAIKAVSKNTPYGKDGFMIDAHDDRAEILPASDARYKYVGLPKSARGEFPPKHKVFKLIFQGKNHDMTVSNKDCIILTQMHEKHWFVEGDEVTTMDGKKEPLRLL